MQNININIGVNLIQVIKLMKSITFKNSVEIIGKLQGKYPTNTIIQERLLNFVNLTDISRKNLGTITSNFLDALELNDKNLQSDFTIIHSWKNLLYKHEPPARLNSNWHFDYPYFPLHYPYYVDDFPCNEQIIYIVSDNIDNSTSNTQFYKKDITIHNLPTCPTWFDIDHNMNEQLDPSEIYKCRDGEIVKYDNKTLHRATRSVGYGWRMVIKVCSFDKDVYENIKKILG